MKQYDFNCHQKMNESYFSTNLCIHYWPNPFLLVFILNYSLNTVCINFQ